MLSVRKGVAKGELKSALLFCCKMRSELKYCAFHTQLTHSLLRRNSLEHLHCAGGAVTPNGSMARAQTVAVLLVDTGAGAWRNVLVDRTVLWHALDLALCPPQMLRSLQRSLSRNSARWVVWKLLGPAGGRGSSELCAEAQVKKLQSPVKELEGRGSTGPPPLLLPFPPPPPPLPPDHHHHYHQRYINRSSRGTSTSNTTSEKQLTLSGCTQGNNKAV
eukprot:1161716-Pelagomonas_calceolata.AAC.17